MTTLAVIPARGGSKRIPRKNLRDLGGRPLVAWTIDAALEATSVDWTVVSTEDAEIAEVAEEYGAEVVDRPARLAEDHVPSRDVVAHAVRSLAEEGLRPHRVMLLHPTSPFRTAAHIDEAGGYASVWCERSMGSIVTFTNDELNGALYLARRVDFMGAGSFMRLPIRPLILDGIAGLDIDTPKELEFARKIVAQEGAA